MTDIRKIKDGLAAKLMLTLGLGVLSLSFIMAAGLFLRARPILKIRSLSEILFSTLWHPSQGAFGMASFITGTLWVTTIAMLIAVPLSLLTAIFLAEYAPGPVRKMTKPVIDVLAGISPVIYGFWGVVAIVPVVRDRLVPFFNERFPFFPFRTDNYTGFCALTGGIVLAVMVSPIMISIIEEVLSAVPAGIRESSLALGATKWQTTKHIVLKKARPGIIAAVILALARAFGETIAVLMVSGCALGIMPHSIFDPAYPLPALIANTYGEMMSVPLYDAAVLMAALMLLAVTTFFNSIGWSILVRIEARGY